MSPATEVRSISFLLQNLPYRPDALLPHLSADAIGYHHAHHEKSYVDTVNRLLPDDRVMSTADDLADIAARASGQLANAAAQAWNHAFYWTCMSPAKTRPDRQTTLALQESFGSVDEFRKRFRQACLQLFGSGWVWLIQSSEGRLDVLPTPNAGLRVHEEHMWPLLVCDVWEHAYYIDYRGDRARYVDGFIEMMNWKCIAERLSGSAGVPGRIAVANREPASRSASPHETIAGGRDH